MTDVTPNLTVMPTWFQTLLNDYAQKGLTILATSSLGVQLIPSSLEAKFVSGGVTVVLFIASCAWTYVAARIRRDTLKAAIVAPAAIPVTSASLPATVAALRAVTLPQS
jgi:hypothetical protein